MEISEGAIRLDLPRSPYIFIRYSASFINFYSFFSIYSYSFVFPVSKYKLYQLHLLRPGTNHCLLDGGMRNKHFFSHSHVKVNVHFLFRRDRETVKKVPLTLEIFGYVNSKNTSVPTITS